MYVASGNYWDRTPKKIDIQIKKHILERGESSENLGI